MERASTVPVPVPVSLDLMIARVEQISQESGARALILKGPFAYRSGLRARAVSSDVDVLVEPGRSADVVARLERVGWRPRPGDPRDDVFPVHSVSLFHPRWPIDIDVHESFPGLDGAPRDVFEALWETRAYRASAGIDVATTGPAGTVLVLAVNALRAMWSVRSVRDLEHLKKAAPLTVGGSEVVDLARATGALGAARPFLEEVYPDESPGEWPAASRLWHLYSLNPESASFRLIALREASPARWPRMILHALVPSRSALASTNLVALEASTAGLWRLRWQRLVRALRSIPRIYRGYREFRREERP